MKCFIFGSLFAGFFLLFREAEIFRRMNILLKKTRADMEFSARQRTLDDRKRLMNLQKQHSVLWFLEKQLQYSGLRIRFPKLTAEWWIVGNLAVLGITVVAIMPFGGIRAAVLVGTILAVAEIGILKSCRTRNLRRVNENLLKLLDFLGNYSVTAGEVTGVLEQVSRYMEEPIRSALDTCCIEAQLTGDTGMALLAMGECIEHPKFKELARNMEVSVRYCADFSAMVNGSRRSMREYLRVLQERKGMLREAFVNMIILLGMSILILATVGNLIAFPIWTFLWKSLPGRIALSVVAVIFFLFMGQAGKIQV